MACLHRKTKTRTVTMFNRVRRLSSKTRCLACGVEWYMEKTDAKMPTNPWSLREWKDSSGEGARAFHLNEKQKKLIREAKGAMTTTEAMHLFGVSRHSVLRHWKCTQ